MRTAAAALNPFEWAFTRVGPDTVRTPVDPDAAVFAGHFPARPVVPGVCLIDLVRRAAQELGLAGRSPGLEVSRARFGEAVLPGDRLDVTVVAY